MGKKEFSLETPFRNSINTFIVHLTYFRDPTAKFCWVFSLMYP